MAGVSDGVMNILIRHNFPGNVRELENIIEHALVLCHGNTIDVEHLPHELVEAPPAAEGASPLDNAEKKAVSAALRKHGGKRVAAAEELGISTVTLWRKIKKYGIDI